VGSLTGGPGQIGSYDSLACEKTVDIVNVLPVKC
jgi:hypothetical protein